MLVSPTRNPVRDQLYEAQVEHYHLTIKARQLKTRLKQATKGGRRFKMAYVKEEISGPNKALRVKYGEEHQNKTVEDSGNLCIIPTKHILTYLPRHRVISCERRERVQIQIISKRGERKRG